MFLAPQAPRFPAPAFLFLPTEELEEYGGELPWGSPLVEPVIAELARREMEV